MKMFRITAATLLLAMGMQVSALASSGLYGIPTVMDVNSYAEDRTVEEVLQKVVNSAKDQLGPDGYFEFDKVAPTPVVEEKPAQTPATNTLRISGTGLNLKFGKNSLFTQKF